MDVEARRVLWQSMQKFTDQGRSVVFATHYLDEADTYADRIIMLNAGKIVADGTPSEVKAVVSGRRIRASFNFERTADIADDLQRLSGVTIVEHRGEQFTIVSDDSDAALRMLLNRYPDVHDIKVIAHNMDDAFLALTAASRDANQSAQAAALPGAGK